MRPGAVPDGGPGEENGGQRRRRSETFNFKQRQWHAPQRGACHCQERIRQFAVVLTPGSCPPQPAQTLGYNSRALGTARHMSVCCVVHALRAGRGLPVGLSPNLPGKCVFVYGIRLLRTHSLRRTLHDRVREDDFHSTYIPEEDLGEIRFLGGSPAHFTRGPPTGRTGRREKA